MFARRSGISLFGGGPSTSRLSLNGINEIISSFQEFSPLTKEYLEIKEFININFMGPLMKKKMDLVKLNAFNFEYLIKKLSNFSLLYDDADIFLKLIESIKGAIEISNENIRLNEIVYGESKDNTLVFKTTAVEFKPEYQIFISLYGEPESFEDFKEDKLDEIRDIIKKSPAISYRDLVIKLGIDPSGIKKIEKEVAIDWDDLPDDPTERRKIYAQKRGQRLKN